jgi:D-alanine-D-alanine ligase
MNIVVLCGGTSTEREISLVTGEMVCKALLLKGHNSVLMDVFLGDEDINVVDAFKGEISVEDKLELIREKSKDLEDKIKNRKEFFGPNVIELCKEADIVFMALHGSNGEDGKVQGAFDLLGIKYTGADSISSAMAMNKAITKKIFDADKVPQPKGFAVYKDSDAIELLRNNLNYPCVVKPSCGGSSIGVYIVNNDEEYLSALNEAFKLEDEIIVEECIKGREFSIGIVDYKAFPIIEIIPKQGFYDFENKYKAGSTDEICPAELSDEITVKMQEAALKAAKSLNLSVYSRVDVLMNENEELYCLEANTLPGMTPTSLLPQEALAIGMDFPALCEYLIEVSLKKYRD